MHETIKFYDGTLHAIGQLALITPNVLIKMAVFVDFALFFNKRIFGKISYFFLN